MMNKHNKPKAGLILLECSRFQKLGQGTSRGIFQERMVKASKGLVDSLSKDFKVIFPGMISSNDSVIAVFMSWSEDFVWIKVLRDMPDIPMIFYLPVSDESGFNDSKSEDDQRFYRLLIQDVGYNY